MINSLRSWWKRSRLLALSGLSLATFGASATFAQGPMSNPLLQSQAPTQMPSSPMTGSGSSSLPSLPTAPTTSAPTAASPSTIIYGTDGLTASSSSLSPIQAQQPKNPFSATVRLAQDSFFGFYPILNGYYNITDNLQFSFYGQLWTTPSFSVNGRGGSGLWTEVGIGFNYSMFDGGLTINPQIGVLNGVLLSGSSEPQAFEGIVPTVTINQNGTFTEGEFYFGYYLATAAPRNNDFVHWWINGGVKPFAESESWLKIVSVGAHFEQLWQTRNKNGATGNLYTWLGPYVQFKLPSNVSLRFSSGWDLERVQSDSFYKLQLSYAF
jgi:hypothetical protein